MPRRHNRTGRSRSGGARFVQIEHYILRSVAFRSLSPPAKIALLYVRARYMGSNNGRIPMSARELAAEANLNKNTACRALRELQAKGFIKLARQGAFRQGFRSASEYILTMEPYGDALPTKDFMTWRRESDFPVPFVHTNCMPQTDGAYDVLRRGSNGSVPTIGTTGRLS